jgi:DedD protein
MAKSKEFRELQVSSGQLAAVILSLLALCVFIFFLGTRVGAKKSLLSKAGIPTLAKTENVVTPKPFSPDPAPSTLPTENIAPASKPVAEPPKTNEPPAGTKPAAAADASSKPRDPATTPETKMKTPAEVKPAAPKPKTETAVPPAAIKPAVKPSGAFFVQVAALDARTNAETFARKIETLGFSAVVLDPLAGDKRTVYRVRIGPFETKAQAEDARTKLADALKKKKTDYFLIKG